MASATDLAIGASCAIAVAWNSEYSLPVLGVAMCHLASKGVCMVFSGSRIVPLARFTLSILGAACCQHVSQRMGSNSMTSWILYIPATVFWAHKWGLLGSLLVVPSTEYIIARLGTALERNYGMVVSLLEQIVVQVDRRPIIHALENQDRLDVVAPLRCKAQPAPTGSVAAHDTFCAVCQETFSDVELHRVLPCGHGFHACCVDPWILQRSATCPMCRTAVA